MKSSGLAAVLSFFVPGVGQIYNGQILKGLLLFAVATVCAWLMVLLIGFILYPVVWIFGIYDAYNSAERISARGWPTS